MGDRLEEQLEELEALEELFEESEIDIVSREPPICVRITVRCAYLASRESRCRAGH